jgi:hypothetical protein
VNAEAGELLTVAKELDGVVLDLASVGLGEEAVELDSDLFERLGRAAENRSFGLATKANHDAPTNGRQFRLGHFGRGVGDFGAAENVDIESRVVPGENASICLGGMSVRPATDFVLGGLGALLPRLKRDRLTCKWHGIVAKRPQL